MEIIELTEDNIDTYLADCVALQQHLIKPGEVVEKERFKSTASDSHSCLLGVLIDECVVGIGEVCKLVHPVHTVGYIHNIVVAPEHRGKGLFKLIMDALEAKAKLWGCDQMNLTCSRSEVQSLYEKRGYLKKDTNFYTLQYTL